MAPDRPSRARGVNEARGAASCGARPPPSPRWRASRDQNLSGQPEGQSAPPKAAILCAPASPTGRLRCRPHKNQGQYTIFRCLGLGLRQPGPWNRENGILSLILSGGQRMAVKRVRINETWYNASISRAPRLRCRSERSGQGCRHGWRHASFIREIFAWPGVPFAAKIQTRL